MGRTKRIILAILYIICALSLATIPVSADTDGTEPRMQEASRLEIQLGPDWAGTEFSLRTDVGLYPGTIPVSEDGILHLEIGGSSEYILSCLGTSDTVQSGEAVLQQEVLTETDHLIRTDMPKDSEMTVGNTASMAGVVPLHLALFFGGLAASIATLIGIRIVSKNKDTIKRKDMYDDEDE